MAGRVYDDVVAPGRLKEGLGGVNGHLVPALFLEVVHQVRVLHLAPAFQGDLADFLQPLRSHGAGVAEEPADQRGFPVVEVADDDQLEGFPFRHVRSYM